MISFDLAYKLVHYGAFLIRTSHGTDEYPTWAKVGFQRFVQITFSILVPLRVIVSSMQEECDFLFGSQRMIPWRLEGVSHQS